MNSRRGAPGSQTSLREANLARVRETLRRDGSMTQVELAQRTGLSPASISNLVKDLFDLDHVDVSRVVSNGRRATLVSLTEDKRLFAALHFGQRDLTVAVSRNARDILCSTRMPLAQDHAADASIDRAAYLVADLLGEIGLEASALSAVAVGLPAPVDAVSGQVGAEAIMDGWKGVNVASAVGARLACPVVVDNDANAAAAAELRSGAMRGIRNGVYLHCGYGIGAGLVLDGRIFRGSAGTAGEIGHTTLDEDGVLCPCGNRGCLDTFVGSRALLAAVRATHGPMRFHELLSAAASGDAGSVRVVTDAGRHLGHAAATLVNVLNPEVIVVGGMMSRVADVVMPSMRQVLDRSAIPSAAASVELRAAELGGEGVIMGLLAGAMAFEAERS